MNRANLAAALVAVAFAAVGWAMTTTSPSDVDEPSRYVTSSLVCTVGPQMYVRPVGLRDDR